MINQQRIQQNVQLAHTVRAHLREVGCDEAEIGPLGADLSDLYGAALHFRELLDGLLAAPPQDRERIGDTLAELWAELLHLQQHTESALATLRPSPNASTTSPPEY